MTDRENCNPRYADFEKYLFNTPDPLTDTSWWTLRRRPRTPWEEPVIKAVLDEADLTIKYERWISPVRHRENRRLPLRTEDV